MMIKGVLFDFNGTMFQDSPFNEEAWLTFAEKEAHKQLTRDEFDQNVHGKNNRLVLEYLFERPFTKEEAIEWGEKKEAIYRKLVRSHPDAAHLTAGLSEFLDDLKQKQVPFNIATAAGKGNVDFYFEAFDLGRWFDYEKVIYDNGEMKSKPAPDFYLQSAEKIGLKPSECVVFEDSVSGIKAAHNAAAKKIFAITTDGNGAMLSYLGNVDAVIDDFTDSRVRNLFA